jgi:hypothetical protein
MDLDIQNFGDYKVENTFVGDSHYNNFLPLIAVAPAILIKKKMAKKKDAEQRKNMANISLREADNRLAVATTIEARRKAEADKLDAENKILKAEADKAEAEKSIAEVSTTTPPPPSDNKKYLMIGGGIVALIVIVVLLKRK